MIKNVNNDKESIINGSLRNINYAFTNASESQIQNMNEKIYQDTGLAYVFKKCVF